MRAIRRLVPADRKLILIVAPVLALVLVLVAGRLDGTPATEQAASRRPTTTTTSAPARESAAAGAVAAESATSGRDAASSEAGTGSGVSGTDWTDGYSPAGSEARQAALGIDGNGQSTQVLDESVTAETTVPDATVSTTTVPGATTTTVPGTTTTTTIVQPPAALDESIVTALLPISAVVFAALALAILARRNRRSDLATRS